VLLARPRRHYCHFGPRGSTVSGGTVRSRALATSFHHHASPNILSPTYTSRGVAMSAPSTNSTVPVPAQPIAPRCTRHWPSRSSRVGIAWRSRTFDALAPSPVLLGAAARLADVASRGDPRGLAGPSGSGACAFSLA